MSDYLEYEVKGTPWGWKNNIDTLAKIEGLKNLKYLKKLDLSNNLLRNIEEIVSLKSITHLNLANNKISELKNIAYINELPNLKYLNLEGNPMSQIISLKDFNKDFELVLTNKFLEIK
jgi:Leucine-rich repeat (LRR) protein